MYLLYVSTILVQSCILSQRIAPILQNLSNVILSFHKAKNTNSFFSSDLEMISVGKMIHFQSPDEVIREPHCHKDQMFEY